MMLWHYRGLPEDEEPRFLVLLCILGSDDDVY